MFWLPAQTLNFVFVPPVARVVYVGTCASIWVNILACTKRQPYYTSTTLHADIKATPTADNQRDCAHYEPRITSLKGKLRTISYGKYKSIILQAWTFTLGSNKHNRSPHNNNVIFQSNSPCQWRTKPQDSGDFLSSVTDIMSVTNWSYLYM
jgi:uncharacterized membrane protein YqaE (UPF0057 family)